jgi:molybdenum cofactor cytidylyltransferase
VGASAQRPDRIVGILLAAGAATRFGSNKLLHALRDGQPIAVAALRPLRMVLPRVIAVVRPGSPEVMRLLRAGGAEVVVCDRADEGMGASLAYAVRAAPDAQGWIVALADMPFIQSATIARLAAELANGAAVVAPLWQGERGHPVGFSARFGDALKGLHGDVGARELLRAHRDVLETIDCNDPGVVRDVDTPSDLLDQ